VFSEIPLRIQKVIMLKYDVDIQITNRSHENCRLVAKR
jgi:hypothetical protein